MRTGFKIGDLEFLWLNGGRFELDGGAMFGVVPKKLWQKRYPADSENCIPLVARPILVRTPKDLVLIDSGLGNKLTEKQRKIYRVREDWSVPDELGQLGIAREDIGYVILTHYDFDHAGGVIMQGHSGSLELTFPKAKHVLQRSEWSDVLHPNSRNINTYWPVNYELIRESGHLELVDGDAEVLPEITVYHTAGHNNGHQIVEIESRGETALHLGDLLPTHAHSNPLWVMAYDNYPLDSIAGKEQWITSGVGVGAWFTFYHDAFMQACRFDEKGNITDTWPEERPLTGQEG
jgi:glyoxylase-like metal-dependent hydrolase (beta-lactamase superfamily II)